MVKKILLGAVAFVILAAIAVGGFFLYAEYEEVTYNKAMKFIKRYEYDMAMTRLKEFNERRDKDFATDSCKGEHTGRYYKDSAVLYAYARALYEFDTSKTMSKIEDLLNVIPEDYSGDMAEDIKLFRERFAKEKEILAKENEKIEAQRDEIMRNQYKDNVPAEGMDEKFVEDTLIGKADEVQKDEKTGINKYIWYAKRSKDITTEVICEGGKVTKVTKNGMGYYWKDEYTPDFSAKKPK